MENMRVIEDLSRSGLSPADMNVRAISNPEKAATNTPHSTEGYVIPYYTIHGKNAAFYRVRLFDSDPKYRQPKESQNHVYFPKGFIERAANSSYIIITEGEKKAASAVKHGYAACAFGGVDSWRNRTLVIPPTIEVTKENGKAKAKLTGGDEITEDQMSPLALGMQDLIDYSIRMEKNLIIIYDSESELGTGYNVQRAASSLGFELRFKGIPFERIRQITLPLLEGEDKAALDDFLESNQAGFEKLVEQCLAKPSAFPRHPNIQDYLNKRLQKVKMSRKETQQVSIAILSELDATGRRLISSAEQQSYYFDLKTHRLMRTKFTGQPNELTETRFGQYLYQKFGIGSADARVIQWLGSHFTGEQPISDVQPHKVIGRVSTEDDNVMLQISDGAYVIVDANGIVIRDNGDNNILFEADQVKPIDKDKLKAEFMAHVEAGRENLKPWWADVLQDVRLKDKDKARWITALLFYASPWLYKWRGTQLPVEMTLGEAGSGKSTLQELRLNIQTGYAKLRNTPTDIKDWYASVINSGGLHITDNVQLVEKGLRQKMSDELCRLVTEPNPTIEQRKYYTNKDLLQNPVTCVFGITAIQQPFLNTDIIQRSIMIELDKSLDLMNGDLQYNSTWMQQQLNRFGGREAWLAHHLYVLHLFFQEIKEGRWDRRYNAKHRLINMEQIFIVLARIFGIPHEWIPNYLNGVTETQIISTDATVEGLQQYVVQQEGLRPRPGNKPMEFGTNEIATWAEANEDYCKVDLLINSRKLARYMRNHKALIASSCGIFEHGSQNNRTTYIVVRKK
jgi:hypothetical protein